MTRADHPTSRERSMRARWSEHARRATATHSDAEASQAIHNFEQLTVPQQIELARELAVSRKSEIARAHRNVVLLAAGMKRRGAQGREQVSREPCVVIFVRRKWRAGERPADHPQYLPARLLTHVDGPQGRLLVSVPTDVQLERRLSCVRPQGNGAICVELVDGQFEFGALTALVQLDDGNTRSLRTMSAMHVLSPEIVPTGNGPLAASTVEQARGFVDAQGAIQQRAGAPVWGSTSREGGRLVPGPDLSFDVQLVDLAGAAQVAHMLSGVPLSATEPFIADTSRYDALVSAPTTPRIQVLVPDNHPEFNIARSPVDLSPSGWPGAAQPMPYADETGATMMIHILDLLELRFATDQTTAQGDSGSPVVLWFDDGTCALVGMHVAGEAEHCYVIPAWQLLTAGNYCGSLPPGTAMTLATQT